jgi:hypothetical protein
MDVRLWAHAVGAEWATHLLLRNERFRSECPKLHSRAIKENFRLRPTPAIRPGLTESPSWLGSQQ